MSDAVAGAATATAGLVLVFLGATSAAYDSYQPAERKAVRLRYQIRAWIGFGALLLSILSAPMALAAKWLGEAPLAVAAFICLVPSLACVVLTAYLSVSEIK